MLIRLHNPETASRSLSAKSDFLSIGILKRETKTTPYTRFGWLFPWFVLALAVVLRLKLLFTPPPFRPSESGTVSHGGLRFTTHKPTS